MYGSRSQTQKLNNISSFVHPRSPESNCNESDGTLSIPVQYLDVITLEHSKHWLLGIENNQQMLPGTVQGNQVHGLAMGLFQILPIVQGKEEQSLRYEDKFYLRHVESNLLLSAQTQVLRSFTNIYFQKQPSLNCVFSFQPQSEQTEQFVINRKWLRLKNIQCQQYLRIQLENRQGKQKKASLWLSQNYDSLRVTVISGPLSHPTLLLNYDVVLIRTSNKQGPRYLGVSKSKGLVEVTQRRQSPSGLEAQINFNYFNRQNCCLQMFTEQDGKSCFLFNCLWQIQRYQSQATDLSFLVRAKEELKIKHVETGLCLALDGTNNLTLQLQSDLKIQNTINYNCQTSIRYYCQPIYINHPIIFAHSAQQKCYQLERVIGNTFMRLFSQSLQPFLLNLAKFMTNPRQLTDFRECLNQQIKFYIYLYQQFQKHVSLLEDGGFYFFEFTLKILQMIKSLVKDQKANNDDSSLQIRRTMLKKLVIQMLKFMSLVVVTNQILMKLTAEDHRKAKDIIQIIYVLYIFEPLYTLNLMVALSNADPHLVVKMLAERLCIAPHFQERVHLLRAIGQIIQQFRRINFDEETLKIQLQKQHTLTVQEDSLCITFKNNKHKLLELVIELQRIPEIQESASRDERQNYFQKVYLLLIIKALFDARLVIGAFEENILKRRQKASRIIQKMKEHCFGSSNIDVQTILIDICCQIISDFCRKQMIVSNKLHFIRYHGIEFTIDTPLTEALTIGTTCTIQWFISQQQIQTFLQQILNPEWQRKHQILSKLRFLSKMVDILIVCLITASFNIKTLHKLQQFCISVSSLFYRKRLNFGSFIRTRQLISSYAQKISQIIVDGLKLHLDEIMSKLNNFFISLLSVKKRLYVYPSDLNRTQIFRFKHFTNLYSQLILNQRLRKQIPALQQLLKLNQEKLDVEGLILCGQTNYSQCLSSLQHVIQDLQLLGIMMESYRMYQQSALKDNMIASMKLKILNIEEQFKIAFRNRHFQKCSDAYNLGEHILDFILQNSFEQQLVQPIIETLLDKTNYNANILTFLRSKEQLLFEFLCSSKNYKNSKMLVRWIGKQFQKIAEPVTEHQVQFLYEDIIDMLDDDPNSNLLYLASMMKQVGLQHTQKQQILYSRLIESISTRQFIESCSSPYALKLFSDRLQKDVQFRLKSYQLALQLILIFRLCQSNPNLMSHLQNRLSYYQLFSIISSSTDSFSFYKPIVCFLITDPKLNANSTQLLIQYVQEIERQLSIYKRFVTTELFEYQPRFIALKEKESNKAATHFCRTNTLPINPTKNIINQYRDESSCYWQYLMWVPFYCKSQGLLVFLEKLLKIIINQVITDQTLQRSLDCIEDYLKGIADLDKLNNQQHKLFIEQVHMLLDLLELRRNKKQIKKSRTEVMKVDQQIQGIYKLLSQHNLMKPFIKDILQPILKKQQKTEDRISECRSSAIKIQFTKKSINRRNSGEEELLIGGDDHTNREKTHHSLIAPQKLQSRMSIKSIKASKSLNILLFLNKLKLMTGYKLKLYLKLQGLFLQYFSKNGTVGNLEYRLMQQLNSLRDRVTTYRQQNLQYQFNWRRMKGKQINVFSQMVTQDSIFLGIQVISVDKLQQLLQEQKLQSFCQFLNQLFKMQQSQDHKQVFQKQYCRFQKIFLKLLNNTYIQEEQLTKIMIAVDNLLDILIKYRKNEEELTIDVDILYSSLSYFIYQISNIDSTQNNYQLFLKMTLFVGKIQFNYLFRFNYELQELATHKIMSKIPAKCYCTSIIELTQQAIFMLKSNKRFRLQQFFNTFGFLYRQTLTVIDSDFFSQNMLFYQNRKFISRMFNFLQLLITHTQITYPFPIPKQLMTLLIKLQVNIFHTVFNSYSLQQMHKERIVLFQSLIIQSLCFFQTLSLTKGQKIWNSRLLQQRLQYIDEQSLPLVIVKQVYEYYESKYMFCMLKNSRGELTAQAFPRQNSAQFFKEQFNEIICEYSDINQKKDIILSYSLMISEKTSTKDTVKNYMHFIQPAVIVLSTITCTTAIFEWFLSDDPNNPTNLFTGLILFNLVLVTFLIVERILMIRRIAELQIKINRFKNFTNYYISQQKGFTGLAIFLIFINLNTLYQPTYTALLILVHLFSKRNIASSPIKIFGLSAQYLLGLLLIGLAVVLIFALVIEPQEEYSVIPLLNISSAFNIDFTQIWMQIWQKRLYNDGKTQECLIIINSLKYILIAVLMFFYIHEGVKQKNKQKSCQLCTIYSDRQGKQIKNQIVNHIKHEHNIYKFISCFKFVQLKNQDLISQQEQEIREMVRNKNKQIFSDI